MTQREGVGPGQEPTPEIEKCTSEHLNNNSPLNWQGVYCRNPKCRSKLTAPTDNYREAFCMRGCHSSFYLHRCLACERQMPRNAEHQKVCHRSECKRAWRLKTIQSRFLGWDSCQWKDGQFKRIEAANRDGRD